MHNPARQRAFALEIAQKLRAAGFEALWAGGCVRDELLGLTPKDYDVATSATPDQIRDLFGRRRTLPIGASFGVITVLGPRDAGQIEVATFRTDAAYSDGRHPDSVTFTTAEHDAQRRDFTINGLFYDPVAEQVVDYVGGQEDLKAHILRAIGDPRLRLSEDKLRMLRAVRFAAAFKFAIDPGTFVAIQDMAPQIGTVSAERIGMEIRRMLMSSTRARSLALLGETNLLVQVLPEIASLTTEPRDETSRVLDALKEPSISLALAALLFLTPQPSLLALAVARRLRYTNKEAERTAWLLANALHIAEASKLPWPKLQRLITHDGAPELLELREAIAGPDDPALAFCRERLAWSAERLNPRPLLDGSTLIHHGLTPGPHFSDLLEQVRDAQLNGEVSSQAEALVLVDRLRASNKTLP